MGHTMTSRILDKTVRSFEEATGCLEDTIVWVGKAKDYAQEFDPNSKAYVDLVLVEAVLEKAKQKIHQASNDLSKEIFSS